MNAHGFDMSKYQDNPLTPYRPNFKKAKAAGLEFAVIRAHYGYGLDRDVKYNIPAAQDAGLVVGAYGFPKYDSASIPQAEVFLDLLAAYQVDFVCADVEECPGIPLPTNPTLYRIWANDYMCTLHEYGRPVLFYSSPNIIQHYLVVQSWSALLKFDLWIANYGAVVPDIEPWPTWRIFQYSLGKGLGPMYGMESKDIDLDYYNGTIEEMREWLKVAPPPLTLEQRVERLEKEVFGG